MLNNFFELFFSKFRDGQGKAGGSYRRKKKWRCSFFNYFKKPSINHGINKIISPLKLCQVYLRHRGFIFLLRKFFQCKRSRGFRNQFRCTTPIKIPFVVLFSSLTFSHRSINKILFNSRRKDSNV